jgi:adenosylcobinamide-GDP ribazoletransferase
MKSFWLALQFLTVIRGRSSIHYSQGHFSNSLLWFFVIGLFIGSMQWILGVVLLKYFVPVHLAALLVLIFGILISGGLHLDGVADTADGFGAGMDRDSVLRIMKDDRIGVYGITAIFLNLSAKGIATLGVLNSGHLDALWISPMLSRALLPVTCCILQYARQEGTAKAFSSGNFWRHALPSLVISGVLCGYFSHSRGLLIFAITAGVAFLFSLYCFLRIRGFTGDTLGAQNELAEITALFAGGLLR